MPPQYKAAPHASQPVPSGHRTYHLSPVDHWQEQQSRAHYLPEHFDTDGFIHCTDTIDEVVAVGNRYYQSDPRPYVLLEIDCDAIEAPIVYEDPAHQFPHIYGPLETTAVVRVLTVGRDASGKFLEISGLAGG